MESANCPSCDQALKKVPQRKTKCPACGEFIWVRTRPEDHQQVLTTAAQAAELDKAWAVHHERQRLISSNRVGFVAEREVLTKKFGGIPRDLDVVWSLLQKERQAHSASREWGLFRNSTLEMAQVLLIEGNNSAAIPHLVDVCLIDAWLEENLEREMALSSSALRERFADGVIALLIKALDGAPTQLTEIVQSRREKLPMLSRWGEATPLVCKALQEIIIAHGREP